MKNTKRNWTRNTVNALATALVLCAASLGQAADLDERHAWTSVGSAGSIDESDVGELTLRGAFAGFTTHSNPGSAILRYNIEATDALVGSMAAAEGLELRVAFRDSGTNDRVRVYLKQRVLEGQQGKTTVAVFDSDDLDGAASVLNRTGSITIPAFDFDFKRNAYHLEVMLSKYGEGTGAAILGASLQRAAAD